MKAPRFLPCLVVAIAAPLASCDRVSPELEKAPVIETTLEARREGDPDLTIRVPITYARSREEGEGFLLHRFQSKNGNAVIGVYLGAEPVPLAGASASFEAGSLLGQPVLWATDHGEDQSTVEAMLESYTGGDGGGGLHVFAISTSRKGLVRLRDFCRSVREVNDDSGSGSKR